LGFVPWRNVYLNLSGPFKIRNEIRPILRRFFVNTLFDATFMQLGIVIGSAFSSHADSRLVIGTLVSSSIALAISTGVSVYESETLEREKRIVELERALFRSLKNTTISDDYRSYARVLSLVNFLTPLVCCGIVVVPLVLAALQLMSMTVASFCAMGLALGILFVAGTYLGRLGKEKPVKKGLRMVFFGIVAFVIGYVVQTLV
jgi:predicted membrane protein (TIGR00267 family)